MSNSSCQAVSTEAVIFSLAGIVAKGFPELQMEKQKQQAYKPSVFIGSSVKAVPVAKAVQAELAADFRCEVWTQGTFVPSQSTLNGLLDATRRFDVGVFIFCCDDVRLAGRARQYIPRDNVLFECGLFFGALGQGASFFFVPRGGPVVVLPSDLAGITQLVYDEPDVEYGNLRAAIGPACYQLRRALLGDLQSKEAKVLNGTWSQAWKRTEEGGEGSAFTQAVITVIGDRLIANFKAHGAPYRLVGKVQGRIITGEWESLSRSVHYFGACQLVVAPKGNELRGKWVGFQSNNNIDAGRWIWRRESAKTHT